eukprot:GHVH01005791.1.p1 GENE.GHVH01005791.1~~GHVH01005791.1.p1  ORF type:complete len:414 (-),score=37.41 GHVH01005791.1:1082-2281(-)
MSGSVKGVIVSSLAGMSTVIGAIPVLLIRDFTPRLYASGLALSSGILLYISFIEIFQEGLLQLTQYIIDRDDKENISNQNNESWAFLWASVAFFAGYLFSELFDEVIHICLKYHQSHKIKVSGSDKGRDLELHSDSRSGSEIHCEKRDAALHVSVSYDDSLLPGKRHRTARMFKHVWFYMLAAVSIGRSHIDDLPCEKGVAAFDVHMGEYLQVGLSTAVALMAHNFPEGVATYSGFVTDPALGFGLATAIAIHNIPEGFSVAIPVYLGTGSKKNAFIIASISGLAETMASIIAYLVIPDGEVNVLLFAVLYCFLAGLMTRVSIKELLTTALKFDRDGVYAIPSFFIGMVVIAISLMSFEIHYASEDVEVESVMNKNVSEVTASLWNRPLVATKKHLFHK